MKKYICILFTFFIVFIILYNVKVDAMMSLTGKIIVIDIGHGAEDAGTSYGSIYEKDINLSIGLYLEKELSMLGAEVILTRDGDYDLSEPNATHRKKSDFDNRIKIINESGADIYVSIHLNYLSDERYSGPQVFYLGDSKTLAETIQNSMNSVLNGDREIKEIPDDTYMYSKLNIKGVLIECGFLSNTEERNLLVTSDYQKRIAYSIKEGILDYF